MSHDQPDEKWSGTATADLPDVTADEAWSLLGDFFSIHKWLPGLAICTPADPDPQKPGGGGGPMVRYCAGSLDPGAAADSEPTHWAKERLLEYDAAGRSYSYEIVDNNLGFGAYQATMKAVPGPDGSWCKLVWTFESDPVKGWTREGLAGYATNGMQTIADRIRVVLNKA